MGDRMTAQVLERENSAFLGSGGISDENRSLGFRPAFLNTLTKEIYLSRFADGSPAPFHLLDGLPDEVILSRNAGGAVSAKDSVISGFVLDGRFYSRADAARKVADFDRGR